MTAILARIFPFIGWLKTYNYSYLRADFISGLTVALVLIPQSMAYAQLAGLPPYYGLYAAFLPPMIAALFGSSHQLATGPVAIVSLMTATALEPLAAAGSEGFIAYAIMLALLVGIFQFALGLLKLGLVVNFLSHPVVNGFTNAAALIIATSQLSKIFGVDVDSAAHHYETVYDVVKAAISFTHWPTLALAVFAFIIMIGLKRLNPRIPGVLVAVALTTIISWAIGYEKNLAVPLGRIEDDEARELIRQYNLYLEDVEIIAEERVRLRSKLNEETEKNGSHSIEAVRIEQQIALLSLENEALKERLAEDRDALRNMRFESVPVEGEGQRFIRKGSSGESAGGAGNWRLKIGNKKLNEESILLMGGGAVVGTIPRGFPSIKTPKFNMADFFSLFPMAVIISLLGFMEAISIAKAMAAKTGQRLDPNRELIGQGLANIVGSFGRSYAVSGSFSRSAVNLQAGARTGLSSVFSSCVVAITLILFTPLLYHLPQAVLAAIIMMAVIGLVNVRGFVHAWKAQRYDGAVGIISFVCTLAFAPHLDRGILIGILLSLCLYLLRVMQPKIAMLSLHPDGTFRDAERHRLKRCRHIAVIRYHGSIFFTNVKYLEEKIMERVEHLPHLKHILVVGNGINELDASGEEMLSLLVDRLRNSGYDISFSGLNDSVLDVMRRTYLYEKIGEDHLYRNATRAIDGIFEKAHKDSIEDVCPLREVCFIDEK